MAALQALAAFTTVLRGLPAATIAPSHIGLVRPAAAADLPAIVLSLADAHEATIGLGNLVQLAEVEAARWASTTGRRVKGQLCAELWAADAAAVTGLNTAVLGHLATQASALRSAGFAALSLKTLGPAQPLRTGALDALMLPLAYAAVCEDLATPPTSGDGVIRTVHVDLVGEFAESMDIP